MRAYVTGANGHLGRTLCDLLEKNRCFVRAGIRGQLANYSLDNIDGLASCMQDIDIIFHTAAPTQLWHPDSTQIYQPIYEGTLNIIRAAAKAGVKKIIYTSSCAAVGFIAPAGRALNESDYNLKTKHPQFQAKVRAELDGTALARQLGIRFICVCAPSVLGPGFHKPTPSVEPYIKARQGKLPAIPNFSYHIIDVRDLAWTQFLLATHHPKHSRYIVAGEYVTPELLLKLIGAKSLILPGWTLPMIAMLDACRYYLSGRNTKREITLQLAIECKNSHQRLSIERMKSEFGDFCRYDLQTTLVDLLSWIDVGIHA